MKAITRLTSPSIIVFTMTIFMILAVACFTSPNASPAQAPATGEQARAAAGSDDLHELKVFIEPRDCTSIILDPQPVEGSSYAKGTAVTISLVPAEGCTVREWINVDSFSGLTGKINMNADRVVQVNLVRGQASAGQSAPPSQSSSQIGVTHELELIADPREATDFVLNPKPNSEGAYPAGTTVTIDVLPRAGWQIGEWVGPVYAVAGETAKINMDSSQTVLVRLVASDAPPQTQNPPIYRIGTVSLPVDSGTFTADPPPDAATGLYVQDATVTLSAVAATGFSFGRWEGDCAGATGPECRLTMDSNKTVVGILPKNRYSLELASMPTEGGTLRASLEANAPEEKYFHSTQVSIEPIPATGYEFDGWSGACSGAGSCTVVMEEDTRVVANFKLPARTFTLTTTTTPSSAGTISAKPGSEGGVYDEETSVELTATAAANNTFDFWTGDCSGTNPECELEMDANKSVTANFKADVIFYNLELSVTPGDGGTVSVDPSTTGEGYPDETKLVLTANESDGFEFNQWIGDCAGTSPDCSLTMDSDKRVVAEFVPEDGGPDCTPIAFGVAVNGDISSGVELDCYSFSGDINSSVLVRLGATSGELAPQLRVYGPGGELLCQDATNGILAERVCSFDDGGTYTVLVGDWNGVGTGSYTIYLIGVDESADATPIVSGDSVSGSIDAIELGAFRLSGTPGDGVLFRLTSTSGDLAPQIRVYRPDGTLLCQDATNGVLAERVCVLDTSGIYTILVGDWNGIQAGSYDLFVQNT